MSDARNPESEKSNKVGEQNYYPATGVLPSSPPWSPSQIHPTLNSSRTKSLDRKRYREDDYVGPAESLRNEGQYRAGIVASGANIMLPPPLPRKRSSQHLNDPKFQHHHGWTPSN